MIFVSTIVAAAMLAAHSVAAQEHRFEDDPVATVHATAFGSVRSTNPSLPNAASKVANIFTMSSGPNELSRSRNGRIGTVRSLIAQVALVKRNQAHSTSHAGGKRA
jgi:hypothetical protein